MSFNNYPTTSPSVGSSGQVLTSNGSSGLNWATTVNTNTNIEGHALHVRGDANFEGNLTIKGKSIVDSLEKIEEKLAILHPNEKLEAKWDELRELRNQYIKLETEIKEKEKIWDILKR